ncbi:MAG: alpha-1,2-fucosyltransferase [Synergistaceae bacterium]|nr:alpha-1,2-fucosyltransferase [Synergistaceae bacterium]
MPKKIRIIFASLYKPFRLAIVKPFENSAVYRLFETHILIPLRGFGKTFMRERIKKLTCFRRCVIIGISGGLGNQMCQYSMGKRIEKESVLPVYYDLSWFKRRGMDVNGRLYRNYELEASFPLIKLRTTGSFITTIYRKFFKALDCDNDTYTQIVSSDEPRYIEGCCHISQDDEEAKRDFICGLDFSDANKFVLSKIDASECAVAVHVRRGDYVYLSCEIKNPCYFKEAIKFVSDRVTPQKPTFFVFSDGMDWCRKNFAGVLEDLVFVENNNNDHGPYDMYLMSHCHHFILSDSTFSYWSALLSDRASEKIMIRPGDQRFNFERG